MEPHAIQGGSSADHEAAGAQFGRGAMLALMVGHCAGMIDLVALPVWVATLIGAYHLEPQQAGALPTLFLGGAVVSSLIFSARNATKRVRMAAPLGFAVAAIAFWAVSLFDAYTAKAALHLAAGAAAGWALSATHRMIGVSRNPHRLFAAAGLSLAIFGIAYLGITPGLVEKFGGALFFRATACVLAVAAVVSAAAFPSPKPESRPTIEHAHLRRLSAATWFGMVGIGCMALTQAMLFSFVSQIGIDNGFGLKAVTVVLIALGFVNLIPAPLAAGLQRRIDPRTVLLAGPLAQALIALAITCSTAYAPYAVATSMLSAVMIFTHTFAFGRLATLDPSGRAVAATPAMLMTGAAIGPILGGTLVQHFGYGSLGAAAVAIAVVSCICFSRLPRMSASVGAANEAQSPIY